jgi:hypothetical protein
MPERTPAPTHSNGWRPKLNPTQQRIFDETTKHVLAYGEKGCRPLDTQIYTADGLKRLGGLRPASAAPGEFTPISVPVCSFDGHGTVTALADAYWTERGTEAIKADLAHGGELVGSPRHPVWTCWQAPDGMHGFKYFKLSEIAELKQQGWRFWTPLMAHPAWTNNTLQSVQILTRPKKCKKCGEAAVARGLCATHYQHKKPWEVHDLREPSSVTITPELAYALGALTGDGGLSQLDTSAGFTNADAECVAEVSKGLKAAGLSLSKGNYQSIHYIVVPSGVARQLLRAVELEGLSYEKRIPDIIINSPKAVAAEFLSGLFDTDGTADKNGNVQYCTTSEKLGLDVQELLAAFGILAIRRPKKSASGRPTWTLSLHGKHAWNFAQEIGFKISRKQARVKGPRVSSKCPNGFNHNLYGYPDPIRQVLKKIAFGSRTGCGSPRSQIKFREYKGKRGTTWHLNTKAPWQEKAIFMAVNSAEKAAAIEKELNAKKDAYYAQNHHSREWHNTNRKLHSFGSVPSPEKLAAFCAIYGCKEGVRPFLLSDHWLEIVSTTPCECELADLRVPGCHSFLASGTINHNSGKSIGSLFALVRHCYEEEAALALLVAVQIRTGAEGSLHDLLWVLDIWRNGNWKDREQTERSDEGIGLEYTEPRMDAQTKDRCIYIGNRHGGWSKVILVSIPYPEVVAARMKNLSPSFVMMEEVTEMKGKEYFTHITAQLGRRRKIKGPQQYYANCNPEGPSHWVYQVFWIDCADEKTGERSPKYAVYHVPAIENRTNLPPDYFEDLADRIKDPIERRRLLDGEWVDRPSGDAIFKNYWRQEIHVRGDVKNSEGLVPHKGLPIIISYDPGPVNYSVHFLQMVPCKDKVLWLVLDELNFVGQFVPDSMVVHRILQRMDYWRTSMGGQGQFIHIADSTAFTHRRHDGSYDATRLVELSGGRIRPRACPQAKESVPSRVQMVIGMLLAETLFISAMCPKTIEMFKNLASEKQKEGKYDPNAGLTPKRSVYLHPFDSLTYGIYYFALNPAALSLQTAARVEPAVYGAGLRG